jgi:hypothetical protein
LEGHSAQAKGDTTRIIAGGALLVGAVAMAFGGFLALKGGTAARRGGYSITPADNLKSSSSLEEAEAASGMIPLTKAAEPSVDATQGGEAVKLAYSAMSCLTEQERMDIMKALDAK